MDHQVKKKYWLILVLTLFFGLMVWKANYADPIPNERLHHFPVEISGWTGREIAMEDWVYRSLETSYAILRDYHSDSGQFANLAMVWYDDKEVAIHTPESCLGSMGNYIKSKTVITVKINNDEEIPVVRLLSNDGLQPRLVYYFYYSDGFTTTNQTLLRSRVVMKRMRFQRASASFIRLMTPIHSSPVQADADLQTFLSDIYPDLAVYLSTPQVQVHDS
jgi:EpsI family protein